MTTGGGGEAPQASSTLGLRAGPDRTVIVGSDRSTRKVSTTVGCQAAGRLAERPGRQNLSQKG